jgi:hypothetical protein
MIDFVFCMNIICVRFMCGTLVYVKCYQHGEGVKHVSITKCLPVEITSMPGNRSTGCVTINLQFLLACYRLKRLKESGHHNLFTELFDSH